MKENVTAAIALSVLLSFPAIAGKPTTPPPTATVVPPALYASSGQLVGPMLRPDIVLVRIDGLAAGVFLNFVGPVRDEGATWVPTVAYYLSPGCAGTPYIGYSFTAPGLMAMANVIQTTDGKYTLFAAPASGRANVVTYSRVGYGVCTEEATPLEHFLYPATTTLDLSGYELPLIIK